MVSGGMKVVKYLMFIFNFVFVVGGLALIIVGGIAQSKGKVYTEFLGSKYLTAPAIVIALGVIIFILAFLGCCGAVKQNYCMVTTFGILLFLIFIVEIAAGISAYVYRNELKGILEKEMKTSFNNSMAEDVRKIWADMEHEMHCCGTTGPDSYDQHKFQLPTSCCKEEKPQCTSEKGGGAYEAGCIETLENFFKHNLEVVGGVGFGIAVIEILGMIFAWCLASSIKKEYEGV